MDRKIKSNYNTVTHLPSLPRGAVKTGFLLLFLHGM